MYRRKTDINGNVQPDLFGTSAIDPQAAPVATAIEVSAVRLEPDPVSVGVRGRRRHGVVNDRKPVPCSPERGFETSVPHLLDVRAAAAWLGLSKSTLDKMRCYGAGPRFIRATSRAVRYDPADLAAFVAGRRQASTDDERPS